MDKIKEKINLKAMIFTACTFLLFAFLVYLFPYSGDDWAWGSQIGLDRLKNLFANYNGRYAGNLLVMALTRSKLLNIIFTSGLLTFACFLPKLYASSKKLFLLPFALLLILIMPKEIWVQSITWTAGFSNYFPPILLISAYLLLVKNIFSDTLPIYKKYMPIISAVLGFVSSLFMENVTLYIVAISAIIILFTFAKFKKVYLTHLSHLFASIIGAVLMFTNSAYFAIANEADGYRSTVFSKDLIKNVIDHIKIINTQLFIKNIPFLCVVTALCVTAVVIKSQNSKDEKLKKLSLIAIFINLFSMGIICFKNVFSYWLINISTTNSEEKTNVFIFFFICLYFLSVVIITAICIKNKNKMLKIQLVLLSIPVLVFPLLFVNPIGPRCFLPPYFLGIVFCGLMLDSILDSTKINSTRQNFYRIFATSLIAVCSVCFAFLISIYLPIHAYDIKRNEYAISEAQAGKTEITLCKLPYGSYVWTANPDKDPWDKRYKLFYGIDDSVEIKLVDYKTFDKEVY